MSTKKKLWYSIGALALTLIVAGTSVGITLSALQAKVQSNFSVTYTAHHINASVEGFYQYIDSSGNYEVKTMTTPSGDDRINFTADSEGSGSFSQLSLELNLAKKEKYDEIYQSMLEDDLLGQYVPQLGLSGDTLYENCDGSLAFVYTIGGEIGDPPFKVNMKFNGELGDNLKIQYYASEVYASIALPFRCAPLFASASLSSYLQDSFPEDIVYSDHTDSWVLILVKISLIDKSKSITESHGTFEFTLY